MGGSTTNFAIWKYVFTADKVVNQHTFDFSVPQHAKVLSVGVQGDDVVMWALVSPANKLEIKRMAVYMTGPPVPFDLRHRFIGTVQLPDGIVAHIFELI